MQCVSGLRVLPQWLTVVCLRQVCTFCMLVYLQCLFILCLIFLHIASCALTCAGGGVSIGGCAVVATPTFAKFRPFWTGSAVSWALCARNWAGHWFIGPDWARYWKEKKEKHYNYGTRCSQAVWKVSDSGLGILSITPGTGFRVQKGHIMIQLDATTGKWNINCCKENWKTISFKHTQLVGGNLIIKVYCSLRRLICLDRCIINEKTRSKNIVAQLDYCYSDRM